MEWGSAFNIVFDAHFLAAVVGIVLIDLVLAGDNAVVIAMAVRNLPPERRQTGILFGAGAAVALRVVATFFVSQLLRVSLVKLAGGALILWIGVKLFVDGMPEDGAKKQATTVWQAVKLIVIADITLSVDNMLAVGGASHGNLFLLVFGLVLSVPFVVFASSFLSRLMDRFPAIIACGAAVLGKVGAEMMITDPMVARLAHATRPVEYLFQAAGAAGVLAVGWIVAKRAAAMRAAATDKRVPSPSGAVRMAQQGADR